MADIYFSYSFQDRERVAKLHHAISKFKFTVFWDQESPSGKNLQDQIKTQIDASRVVIVFWSNNSTKSDFVQQEAIIALNEGKMLSVLLDRVPLGELSIGFQTIQTLDLSEWNGDLEDEAFLRLINHLRSLIGDAGKHDPSDPSDTAPQPEQYAGGTGDSGQASADPGNTGVQETQAIWLCQYRRSEMPTLEDRLEPGIEESWRTNGAPSEVLEAQMTVGDRVALWRTVDEKKPEGKKKSRGGIVGWGTIQSTAPANEEGRIFVRVNHAFADEPIRRDEILDALGRAGETWPGHLSLKLLDDDEATVFKRFLPDDTKEFHETKLASDRAETTRDLLDRAPLAFTLAHRINRIWSDQILLEDARTENAVPDEPAFVLHIDAPWGGGKTTFANFVSRILNPSRYGLDPDAKNKKDHSLFAKLRLSETDYWPREFAERKWITVTFNAWQNQHVNPPWWNFYEAIRRQCMAALPFDERWGNRVTEAVWRIWSPDFRRTLLAVLLLVAGIIYLVSFEPVTTLLLTKKADAPADLTNTGTIISAVMLAVTGGSGFALIKAFQSGLRKMVDSASISTNVGALGEVDPLERFRRRFVNAVRQFNRPVLVIVDDLDRCDPTYVVELVRGLLTIFRSPRVIFILLGDKSWIEASFAKVHKEMADAHKDDKVTFGGRFTEKAIQLSLVLPEPDEVSMDAYIADLLLGEAGAGPNQRALSSANDEQNSTDALPNSTSEDTSGQQREVTESNPSALPVADLKAFEGIVKQRLGDAHDTDTRGSALASLRRTAKEQFAGSPEALMIAMNNINREGAMLAASSSRSDDEIKHGISNLKDELPGNPRRIKRIINMIAAYQSSAQSVMGIDGGTDEWRQLVLWIVLMSEHPESWCILCADPELAEAVIKGDVDNKLAKASTNTDENPKIKALRRLNETAVAKLIRGDAFAGTKVQLDKKAISWLRRLTPLS